MYNLNQQPTQYYPVNRPVYQGNPFSGLKGRPVASIEEARASIIDFDGSIFYFPDLANKRIYTKQIAMDGTAIMNMYELKEIPIEEPKEDQYVTRQEFEAVIQQLRQMSVPAGSPPEQPAAAGGTVFNF